MISGSRGLNTRISTSKKWTWYKSLSAGALPTDREANQNRPGAIGIKKFRTQGQHLSHPPDKFPIFLGPSFQNRVEGLPKTLAAFPVGEVLALVGARETATAYPKIQRALTELSAVATTLGMGQPVELRGRRRAADPSVLPTAQSDR